MIIRRVSLENIKSYKAADIDLTEGITGISGLNGSGKSTVLEAIGYALFDCLPYTQSEFVRKGEKTGRVSVTFTGVDDVEYTVTRKCGASQAYYIENEQGLRLFEGKVDVGQLLCDVLGYKVSEMKQLESLFENAIGVLQGTFVSEFLESKDKRKAIFDPLLRVEEYNLAARNLLPLKNLVERRVEAMENEKKFLEGRADKLVPLKEERNRLEAEGKDLARLAEEKKKLLDEARVRKEALDAIEKALRDLDGRQQVVAAEHAGAIREHGQARAQLEAAEAAVLRQKESEPGYKAYLAKLEEKEGLEKKRHEKEELQNSINVIHTKLTELKTRDAAGDRTLAEVTQAERELPALEQKTAEQERLEEEKAKIASLASARETELAQVRERMSRAKGSQGNMCPVLLDVECSSVKDFSDYFAGQVRRIESERADLKRKVEENAFKVKALGNPRLELAVKRETLKKREKALAEKAEIVQAMEAKSAELMPLIVRLNSIGPVAKAIDAVNVEIKGFKPQYEAYQQNLKLAGQKEELQRTAAQAAAVLAQSDKKLKEIGAAREEKAKSYDRDSHEKTKVACETLSREMASLAARSEANGRRIVDIGKDIVRSSRTWRRSSRSNATRMPSGNICGSSTSRGPSSKRPARRSSRSTSTTSPGRPRTCTARSPGTAASSCGGRRTTTSSSSPTAGSTGSGSFPAASR